MKEEISENQLIYLITVDAQQKSIKNKKTVLTSTLFNDIMTLI